MELIILFILLFWFIIIASRMPFSFVHIMGLLFTLNLIGIFNLGGLNSGPSYKFAYGMISFAIGIFLANLIKSAKTLPKLEIPIQKQKNEFIILLTFSIPVILVAFSLFVFGGGIPLFSNNGNESRFTISQGLGVPSRMLKFGIPFIVIISGVYFLSINNSIKRNKYLFYALIFVLIFGYLFLGNKAALLYILELLFVIFTCLVNDGKKRLKAFNFIILFSIIGIFTSVVITKSILGLSTVEAISLLLNRITDLAGVGFYSIVDFYVPLKGLQHGLGQWNSFLDLLSTFRLYPRGHVAFLGLELSYALVGLTPSSDVFAFPLTISPFGDFYYDFGTLGIIIGGFLLGIASVVLYKKTLFEKSFLKKCWFIFLQWELVNYADRGAFVGLINNEIINGILVLCLFLIYRRIFFAFAKKKNRKNIKLGKLHSKKQNMTLNSISNI